MENTEIRSIRPHRKAGNSGINQNLVTGQQEFVHMDIRRGKCLTKCSQKTGGLSSEQSFLIYFSDLFFSLPVISTASTRNSQTGTVLWNKLFENKELQSTEK